MSDCCSAATDDEHVTPVINIVPSAQDDSRVTLVIKIVPTTTAVDTQVTQVIKVVPVTSDAVSSSITERDGGDFVTEVNHENLLDIKEESEDVCFIIDV